MNDELIAEKSPSLDSLKDQDLEISPGRAKLIEEMEENANAFFEKGKKERKDKKKKKEKKD